MGTRNGFDDKTDLRRKETGNEPTEEDVRLELNSDGAPPDWTKGRDCLGASVGGSVMRFS